MHSYLVGLEGLKFGLDTFPYFVYASSYSSGETALMCWLVQLRLLTMAINTRPQGYTTFMLNLAEHEIYHAHKC